VEGTSVFDRSRFCICIPSSVTQHGSSGRFDLPFDSTSQLRAIDHEHVRGLEIPDSQFNHSGPPKTPSPLTTYARLVGVGGKDESSAQNTSLGLWV